MIDEWLKTPLGQSLLDAERATLAPVLDGVFGEFGVQVGCWGEPEHFLPLLRTQRAALVDRSRPLGASARAQPERLPFVSDSVDLLLMPHTLDYCDQAQAALREASRVLRSDGQIIVFGFKPGGIWGLKRLLPGRSFPPATRRLIGPRNLTDWLELLDLRIVERQRFFFRLPRIASGQPVSEAWERRGERFWPELAACYMLRAQKRLRTLTPVRQFWRPQPKVVAGLVKPSARVAEAKPPARRVVPFTPASDKRR